MLHDSTKKTIYYNNAVVKVYDIPIFYIPKLSHPDPSVDRRSGFLPPSFADSKNLGSGISIPFFGQLIMIKILLLQINYMSQKILYFWVSFIKCIKIPLC